LVLHQLIRHARESGHPGNPGMPDSRLHGNDRKQRYDVKGDFEIGSQHIEGILKPELPSGP
jgi:hypothetical protein